MAKENMTLFIDTQMHNQLLAKAILMMYLNQYILQLYKTRKSFLQKGWIVDSIIDHNINISKYNPLAGSSYIKLPRELDHPRKGLISIQNIDDKKCFSWWLVRYLNPSKKLDFKDIKFMIQFRHQKHVALSLMGEERKRHYVLIKDFNTFIYNHTLHCGGKNFCCYCLYTFNTEKILKRHIKNCFKINCKQSIIVPKKSEYVKFKIYDRKLKSTIMVYADFESIFVPGNNEKQNLEGFYTNKYQKTCRLQLWLQITM